MLKYNKLTDGSYYNNTQHTILFIIHNTHPVHHLFILDLRTQYIIEILGTYNGEN